MQAIVKIATSQYLVQPGQEILVPKISSSSHHVFDQVLAVINGSEVSLGRPYVDRVQVTASHLDEVSGQKVRVFKFKAKSRYRKTKGFRPRYSRLRIETVDIREK